MATKKLSAIVIDALEDIKARDIKLINVTKLTSVFDHIAIASADSTRQTKALAKNVMDKVKEAGGWIYGTEGELSGEWVLVDCGDVVVHIMQPAIREHYKLEELWSEGKLEFPKPVTAPRARKVVETETKATAKKKPVTKKTAVKKTAAKKPVVKKAAAKKVAAPKVTAKSPKAKKPAAKKKPVAVKRPPATTKKKPAAKPKTVAKKPVAKKKPATAGKVATAKKTKPATSKTATTRRKTTKT